MPSIVIREKQIEADGFTATLIIDGASEYTVAIRNPFSSQEEALLEWYFEEWLRFPFLDTIRAGKAAESVREYGTRLFEQVFSDRNAFAEYAAAIRPNLRDTRIEIFGGPEFHALHWEAMWDSQLPRPFAVECVTLRKHTKPTTIKAEPNPSPVINLLVVTARPDPENDVGYRTISRPLIEAIRKGKLRVNVELLRPGTYEALSKHLEEKGAGFYHVVHFDLHGGVMNYAEFQQGARADRYTLQERYGRVDIPPKAFLFFEGDSRGKADPVEADEIAALLTGKGIPICILNTSQSGKQVTGLSDGRETSLGSRLMAAGIQIVVEMGYSVTVSAAALFVEETYRSFFQELKTETALRLGRLELFNRKNRRAYYNQTIELEDWLLPVVYANRPVDLKLTSLSPIEEEAYLNQRSETFRFEPPTYGFFGRDLDILNIERLLCGHNMLLVQGMGGTGKTTLLNHLREWWETTGFIERSFYFGYDQRAWTLDQLLHEIGQKVFDRFEQATFLTFGTNAKIERLAEKLNGTRFCLMLDNLESVTGQPLAIQNTLDETERNRIRDFLAKLKGGKTFVVLGSRGGEGWLRPKTFGENRYVLRGLDPEAKSGLAEAVLKRYVSTSDQIEEIREDDEFKRLMKLLAGYPLAIEVVLPNLKCQSPTELVAALDGADLQLDNEGLDKTRSIIQCVEYSHGNLSPETQDLLLCLAPFTGHLNRLFLPSFIEILKQKPELAKLDFGRFDKAIQETINWGLLSPIGDEQIPVLQIQPVLPFFLKNRLTHQTDEFRRTLEDGFLEYFDETAKTYNSLMESKEARKIQLGIILCDLDYENLYAALRLRLQRFESILSFYRCLNKLLERKGDVESRFVLANEVRMEFEKYPLGARTPQWAFESVVLIDQIAQGYLLSKQLLFARGEYQKALCLLQSIQDIEETEIRRSSASIHHQLGIVAQELREFNEARRLYQKALNIQIEFNDRYDQASTYHQLGMVAQALREFYEARRCYQQALGIKIEFNGRHDQASTYRQLGIVAQELREFDEARRCHQQALDIQIEFGDRHDQASTYHQLGMVAQALREFDEARRCHQQALDIQIEFNDRYSQASIYRQLGIVAQELREFDEARRCYQQALDIYLEFNDRYSQASIYRQLGIVAQEFREFDEARRYYQQALDIQIEFNDRYSQASSYHQLGMVAQELREFDEAQHCYRQALNIQIEFNDRYNQASTYHQLGMMAQAAREFDQARRLYQKALDIKIEFNDRYDQASTYHQLGMVAQALHEFDQARRLYQKALDIQNEFNSPYDQASTYHQLGMVAQALREFDEARRFYQNALEIWKRFNIDDGIKLCLQSVEGLFHESGDHTILEEVMVSLGIAREETGELLDQIHTTTPLESFAQLKELHGLGLADNRKPGIPNEMPDQSLQEIQNRSGKPEYPKDIPEYNLKSSFGKRPPNEAKLILVGRGGVGKTSLVNRLVEDRFEPNEQKTEGIKITSWDISVPRKNHTVRLNVWDFGGQEIIRATHQFFLTSRSLYLLVLSGREESEEWDADYWLRLIESFGDGSPVIVVLNKYKQHAFDVNRRALREKFPFIQGFIETDCRNGFGIADLKKMISRETDRLSDVHAEFPKSWLALKEDLATMTENYLSLEQFQETCRWRGVVEDNDRTLLTGYLHQLGIILHFSEAQMCDTHVLNPHWVTGGIYAVLNSKRLAESKGFFGSDDLGVMLPSKDYPKSRYVFLIELMRKFDLCFSLRDHDDRYLIPEHLDEQEPEAAGEFKPENCLNFQYHYPMLPKGLLPRFIVRTHKLSEDEPRWRTGVILKRAGCRALVKADIQDKRMFIRVSGVENRRRELLAVILNEFDIIHNDIKGLKPDEMVPLPNYPEIVFSYRKLLIFEVRGIDTFPEVIGEEVIHVSVKALLDGVGRPIPFRQTVIFALTNLMESQLEYLKVHLPSEARNFLVGGIATHAEKAASVINWAEATGGCGLEGIAKCIDVVVGNSSWRNSRHQCF